MSGNKNTKVNLSDQQQVTQYIQELEPQLAEIVETIREIILGTDSEIGERIKWNSPSFYYTGEMKEFDAKEYKRDMVVMNLHRGRIMLVFPTGATITDSTGLLEGKYTDGRRMINFKDLEDVKLKEEKLKEVVRAWLELVEK